MYDVFLGGIRLKVVIVDDEKLAIDLLQRKCEGITDVEVIRTFTNPKQAMEEIPNIAKDLVFLDIEMGSKDGLEVARSLREKEPYLPIVFITAYEQYALKAFSVKAIDYLLKPIDQQRLAETIDYVRQMKQKNSVFVELEEVVDEPSFRSVAMGNYALFGPDGEMMKWRTRKVKELFIYLWHHYPKSVQRSKILVDLWGEQLENRAISLMHTTLYQLRKGIRDAGIQNPVALVNDQYQLDMNVKSDVDQLKEIIEETVHTTEHIEKIIQLYQGDYLEEENYEWAIAERERIRRELLMILEVYVEKELAANRLTLLLEQSLEKMVKFEPYHPHYVYLLIEYYGKQKQLSKMLEVFTDFEVRWYRDLGIDIPSDIRSLFDDHFKK